VCSGADGGDPHRAAYRGRGRGSCPCDQLALHAAGCAGAAWGASRPLTCASVPASTSSGLPPRREGKRRSVYELALFSVCLKGARGGAQCPVQLRPRALGEAQRSLDDESALTPFHFNSFFCNGRSARRRGPTPCWWSREVTRADATATSRGEDTELILHDFDASP
jgi:hypothetical protein